MQRAGEYACASGEAAQANLPARPPARHLWLPVPQRRAKLVRDNRATAEAEQVNPRAGKSLKGSVWLPDRYTKEIGEVQRAGDAGKLLIRHMVR